MAFEKQFIHDSGASFDHSYWRVSSVTINKDQRFGEVVFQGYVNKEALDAGKPAIGSRTFVVRDEKFDAALVSLIEGAANPLELAYQIAVTAKDWEIEDAQAEGGHRAVSFFHDAVQV